jgi:hypothetical protein
MIGVDRCVDFRYAGGFPDVDQAVADGTRTVACISLEGMEFFAGEYLRRGIRVIARYTGESDAAGRYVMQNCSALQIGNEPEFAARTDASWPTGSADDFVNVWNHVANVLVPQSHPQGLPLIGPGIWANDYSKWALVAHQLPGLSAAAVHVYPDGYPFTVSVATLKRWMKAYRDVRADLPLICTEWTARQPSVLQIARAIDTYCEARLWYGPGVAGHELEGTPEYGILALARSR